MMSASIFMTVAIAMERYVAVHYPVDYNQVPSAQCGILYRVVFSANITLYLVLQLAAL